MRRRLRRGTRMLDIACGPGLLASGARARGAVARGVDFSPAMLAVARARDTAVPFDEGDAEALPYGDAAFDAVVANFGIHHAPRPLLALREAHRVLRGGGHVAFSFWAEPGENIAWKLVFDAIGAAWRSSRGEGACARRWVRDSGAMCRCTARGRLCRLHDTHGARDLAASRCAGAGDGVAGGDRAYGGDARGTVAGRHDGDCRRHRGERRALPQRRRYRRADRRGDRIRRSGAEGGERWTSTTPGATSSPGSRTPTSLRTSRRIWAT